MATEEPFDAVPPPDEVWWTRELHRNEKLLDKFMAVLGDNPDWEKLAGAGDANEPVTADTILSDDAAEMEGGLSTDEQDAALSPEDSDEWLQDQVDVDEKDDSDEADADEDPEVNADFPTISRMAREFACAVFDLDDPPGNAELLYLSAGKIGANLAGGHGLGYDEEFICGNIVKCRWALSDCEFCREMLEQLHEKTGEDVYARLADDSRRIAEVIRERISRLRQRVWW
jgi:hypothetical protein